MKTFTRVSAVALFYISFSLVAAQDSPDDLLGQAEKAIGEGKSKQAVSLLDQVIKQSPDKAVAYYLRGREHFRLGKIDASVADFDRYVKLEPRLSSRQWERGIALYYAGKFKQGAEQFELYQTYHDNDVENSVWRYLCMVPDVGVEAARKVMLPIKNDRRVPMMQVFEMYRGNLKPEAVLEAVKAGEPSKEVLDGRMFYAQLYLGLYYESLGKKDLSRKYILASADDHANNRNVNRYMWDVARIHADLLRDKKVK